jgi:mycothiol synthase
MTAPVPQGYVLTEMEAPPPAPEWPEGISVRTFVPGQDDHAFHEAMEEGLADEWGHAPLSFADWHYHMVESRDGFDPALYFMVMDGDQVAGGALCRWERPGKPGTGHIRNLTVCRPWRGRGVGLALLRHILGEFYRRGKRQVGLGVDAESPTGAQRLYRRGGMRVVAEPAVFTKELT